MSSHSNTRPAGAARVRVVGGSATLRQVATQLRTGTAKQRADFRVETAKDFEPNSGWRGVRVAIIEAKAFKKDWFRESRPGGVLFVGTFAEIEAVRVAETSKARVRRSDFVRIPSGSSATKQIDSDAYKEIRFRVERLLEEGPGHALKKSSFRRPGLVRTTGEIDGRGAVGGKLSKSTLAWCDPASGRLHAGLIAESLGVSLKDFAAALGRKYTAVHKTPDAAGLQELLGPFARVVELLQKVHDDAGAARAWLSIPHRELRERAPRELMFDGRAAVVRDMLEAAYLGIPT